MNSKLPYIRQYLKSDKEATLLNKRVDYPEVAMNFHLAFTFSFAAPGINRPFVIMLTTEEAILVGDQGNEHNRLSACPHTVAHRLD